jgi:hypothetical protein
MDHVVNKVMLHSIIFRGKGYFQDVTFRAVSFSTRSTTNTILNTTSTVT